MSTFILAISSHNEIQRSLIDDLDTLCYHAHCFPFKIGHITYFQPLANLQYEINSLHVFDSKWNLHFNNVNDYVRNVGSIHILQNKNIILV